MRFAVMFFLAFFSAVPAYADGDVYVVDGDSLKLGEQNVRLAHIIRPANGPTRAPTTAASRPVKSSKACLSSANSAAKWSAGTYITAT